MNCQVLLTNERAAPVIQPVIGDWRKLGYTGLVLVVDFESLPLSGDVDVFGRRNSFRLEPDLWDTLREIDLWEKRTMHDICPNIDKTRGGPRLT